MQSLCTPVAAAGVETVDVGGDCGDAGFFSAAVAGLAGFGVRSVVDGEGGEVRCTCTGSGVDVSDEDADADEGADETTDDAYDGAGDVDTDTAFDTDIGADLDAEGDPDAELDGPHHMRLATGALALTWPSTVTSPTNGRPTSAHTLSCVVCAMPTNGTSRPSTATCALTNARIRSTRSRRRT